MVETILRDYHAAYGLKYVCFRYFNASGADQSGRLGEVHNPETHLVPLVLKAALGEGPVLRIFGNDYPTPDGTCLRDYVHVSDLADAHVLGLKWLLAGRPSSAFNLGTGTPSSVLDVVRKAEAITGLDVPYQFAPRRAGDPPALYADASLARSELGWVPRFPDIADSIRHAWDWETVHCRQKSNLL